MMPVGPSYVGWPDYSAIALDEDTEHVGVMPLSFNPNPYILPQQHMAMQWELHMVHAVHGHPVRRACAEDP